MDIKTNKNNWLPEHIDESQSKDTGMAIVLLCMLFGYIGQDDRSIIMAIVFLVINMTFPVIYRPFAKVWLGVSGILGRIMSKLLLSSIFFIIVTPVGCIMKMFGVDLLKLKKWKQDTSSVFKIRDHLYTPDDIEKPY